jgi:DNA helicase-2/ATP-dependent DNA helicase PcrA
MDDKKACAEEDPVVADWRASELAPAETHDKWMEKLKREEVIEKLKHMFHAVRDEGERKAWAIELNCWDDREAKSWLIGLYLKNARAAQDDDGGEKWLIEAAKLGSSEATTDLGKLCLRRAGSARDDGKKEHWWRLAVEWGNDETKAEAKGNLAEMCLRLGDAERGAKDFAGARELYARAGDYGAHDAKSRLEECSPFRIGEMYRTGDGAARSDGEALKWFLRVKDEGGEDERLALAKMLLEGAEGLRRDEDEAFLLSFRQGVGPKLAEWCLARAGAEPDDGGKGHWRRLAEKLGGAELKFRLAEQCQKRAGEAEGPGEAQRLYGEARERYGKVGDDDPDYAAAQRALGDMHMCGQGAWAGDWRAAFGRYREAAGRGDAEAKARLGRLGETGGEAWKWYHEAVLQGLPEVQRGTAEGGKPGAPGEPQDATVRQGRPGGGTAEGGRADAFNEFQLAAIEAGPGAFLLEAGPGSGKTRVITERMARLIRGGADPARILMLTYTKAARKEMMDRFKKMACGAEPKWIRTFHSCCDALLREIDPKRRFLNEKDREAPKGAAEGPADARDREAPEGADEGPAGERDEEAPENIVEATPENVVEDLISKRGRPDYTYIKGMVELVLESVKNARLARTAEIIVAEIIDSMDAEPPDPEILARTAEIIDMKPPDPVIIEGDRIKELADEYESLLRENNLVDHDLTIHRVVWAMHEHPGFADRVREMWDYVQVDEGQDTDLAQLALLRMIAPRNVMWIADPNQSIYRFRGANYRNSVVFRDIFKARTLPLPTNYRSRSEIVDAGERTLERGDALDQLQRLGGKGMASHRGPGGSVAILGFPTSTEESWFIAETIRHLLDCGEKAKEIAILYRYNSMSLPLELECDRLGIRYVTSKDKEDEKGKGFWDRSGNGRLLNMLRVFAQGDDEKAYKGWLKDFRKGGGMGEKKDEFLLCLKKHREREDFRGWLKESGFATRFVVYAKRERVAERLFALDAVAKAAEDAGGAAKFLEKAEGTIKPGAKASADEDLLVTMSTVHKAKGREWKWVFMVGQADGYVDAGEPEERRVFYVGATRAKDRLFLSYPEATTETFAHGRNRGRGGPSLYLKELLGNAAAAGGQTQKPVFYGRPVALEVDFKDNNEVKTKGAWWEPAKKKWFVPAYRDVAPFSPWVDLGNVTFLDDLPDKA